MLARRELESERISAAIVGVASRCLAQRQMMCAGMLTDGVKVGKSV